MQDIPVARHLKAHADSVSGANLHLPASTVPVGTQIYVGMYTVARIQCIRAIVYIPDRNSSRA